MNQYEEKLHKGMIKTLPKEAQSDAKYLKEAEDLLICMRRPTCLDVDAFQYTRYQKRRLPFFVSFAIIRLLTHGILKQKPSRHILMLKIKLLMTQLPRCVLKR